MIALTFHIYNIFETFTLSILKDRLQFTTHFLNSKEIHGFSKCVFLFFFLSFFPFFFECKHAREPAHAQTPQTYSTLVSRYIFDRYENIIFTINHFEPSGCVREFTQAPHVNATLTKCCMCVRLLCCGHLACGYFTIYNTVRSTHWHSH